MVFSNKY